MGSKFCVPGRKKWQSFLEILQLFININGVSKIPMDMFQRRDRKLYIFKKNTTLITSPIPMPQSRHESSWVHLQQLIRLLVRINLDVLVRNSLDFESDPDSLYKWAFKKMSQVNIAGEIKSARQGRGGGRYQKQLAKSLRSHSLPWFLTVNWACPVAFL